MDFIFKKVENFIQDAHKCAKNVNFCVKKWKNRFFDTKMCFFDTKMDFLLKKWVSTPKWVKNKKNRFLTQILDFFTHFGVRPQKWVKNDPWTPLLGGRPNLIIKFNGGPKKIIKFNGVHEITFLGGRKNGHFWLSNSMVFLACN